MPCRSSRIAFLQLSHIIFCFRLESKTNLIYFHLVSRMRMQQVREKKNDFWRVLRSVDRLIRGLGGNHDFLRTVLLQADRRTKLRGSNGRQILGIPTFGHRPVWPTPFNSILPLEQEAKGNA